ncbi:hypothetical protein [Mycoplasma seminis]|uniref:Spermidine/putrescine transport system substrate-binding protein n=1 Tax=Mycoplasma seminis TaxID=512749 RepID=A0ABY9HBD9_9MOLU|nr:hypothetical protein [Mycoplasma seminis]WLP85928.1 hypothetical protein Q8852_02165 [Mycoplasma seminis]
MKKVYRNLLISSAIVTTGAVVTGSVVYKTTHQYKPAFFNFKSYMSQDNLKKVSQVFTYKQFSEISEFNNALINNKAAAGVSTDFLAAQLVKKGLIQKIDYSILFNDPSLKNNFEKTQNVVRLFLREPIWNHLASYDSYLGNDENNKPKHLWEYFFPYYSQDTTIAYNVVKNPIKQQNREDPEDLTSAISNQWIRQQDFGNNEANNSFINVLKTLKDNNFNSWVITDAMRDNLLYGSSYWLLPDGQRTSARFTGDVQTNTYKTLVDSFKQLIKDGTGYDVKNNRHIMFEGDGLELLNLLINPKRHDINAAIMYNGDAIDAYYGSDNFPESEAEIKEGISRDGNIRVIKPKQNLLLVDGIVLSANNSQSNNQEYLNVLANSVYSNLRTYTGTQNSKENVLYPRGWFETNITDSQTLDLNNNFDKIKTYFTENTIAKVWSSIQQKGEFAKLYDSESLNIPVKEQNNLITKYSDLINLSLISNRQWLKQYQDDQSKSDDVVENYGAKINPAPYMLKEYFLEQKSALLDLISNNIDNLEEEIAKFDSSQFEDKILTSIVLNNLNEAKESLVDNDNKQEALALYLGRKIAFINISNLSEYENIDGWGNLTNFDYINYDPTQEIDYQIVLRNYFADVIEGQDKNAIDIYKIEEVTKPQDQLKLFVKELDILLSKTDNNETPSVEEDNTIIDLKQHEETLQKALNDLKDKMENANNTNVSSKQLLEAIKHVENSLNQIKASIKNLKAKGNKWEAIELRNNILKAIQTNNTVEINKYLESIIDEKSNPYIVDAWKNNGIIIHKALQPINEQISSEASQYYFLQTKS